VTWVSWLTTTVVLSAGLMVYAAHRDDRRLWFRCLLFNVVTTLLIGAIDALAGDWIVAGIECVWVIGYLGILRGVARLYQRRDALELQRKVNDALRDLEP